MTQPARAASTSHLAQHRELPGNGISDPWRVDFANWQVDYCRIDPPKLKPGVTVQESPVPEVVAGSRTMQISNIMNAISIFIHITHECMDSKKVIMWSHTESDV